MPAISPRDMLIRFGMRAREKVGLVLARIRALKKELMYFGIRRKVKARRWWRTVIVVNFITLVAFHIAAFFIAPFFFSESGLKIAAVMYFVSGFGITVGYHRLFTHKSFKTNRPVEIALAICGSTAMEGPVNRWVDQHRRHHKYADKHGDPHTPHHGFSWAHMLWVIYKNPNPLLDKRDYIPDLRQDPFMVAMDRYHWVPQVVLTVLFFGLGIWFGGFELGMSWMLWGIAVRTVFTYHVTWFVNSVGHTWGYRNFETRDDSRNSWWVALVGFGEGWHNNHHGDQTSAAHGMRWFEFDPSFWFIRFLAAIGMARDIKLPNKSKMTALKPRERIVVYEK